MIRFLLVFAILLPSCSKPLDESRTTTTPTVEALARGNRMLGVDILNVTAAGASDNSGFSDNIAYMKQLGAQYFGLHVTWTAIETDSGDDYSAGTMTDPFFASFIDVCVANNLKISLTIRPVDLTGKTVPTELMDNRFNDSIISARFNALLGYVLNITGNVETSVKLKDILVSLHLGNEIDHYNPLIGLPGSQIQDTDFWSDYTTFLESSCNHVHSIDANVKCGFTITFDGYSSSHKPEITDWATKVDAVGITYYPMKSGFLVEDPAHPLTELDKHGSCLPREDNLHPGNWLPDGGLKRQQRSQAGGFFSKFFYRMGQTPRPDSASEHSSHERHPTKRVHRYNEWSKSGWSR